MSVLTHDRESTRAPGEWFTIWARKQPAGRVLDCVVLAERPATQELLLDGMAELASCLRGIADAPRDAEHAGAVVIFGLRDEQDAMIALAAVRGFVLSAAQELGERLKLNLVVHRDGHDDLDPTLDYLTDPASAYVHAATLTVGDLRL